MDRHDEPLNPNAFIICFSVGTVGIIILKWLDVSQFVVTAFPVVIMLGYAIWHNKLRAHLNLVGDNLYYLGLLYTLVSLAASLYEFTLKDEDIESITPIITNFGIAISSTIMGVFFRVYFGLKHTDPEEIEQVARIALADAAYNLRIQLSEATRDFSVFRLEMQQIIRDGLNETKEAIDKELQHGLSQFKTTVTDFTETVQVANEGFEEDRQKLQDRSHAVSESLSELVTRINRIQVSEDFLERIMDSPIQRIEKGADRIGTAGEALADRLNNVQIPTDELGRSLQQAIEGFLGDMGRDLRLHLDKATQEIETVLTEFFQAIKAANEGFEECSQEIRDSTSDFVASIRDLSKRIDNLEVSVDLPERILHPSIEPIEKSADRLGIAGDELAQTLGNVRSAADELEEGIRKTSAALLENSKGLFSRWLRR